MKLTNAEIKVLEYLSEPRSAEDVKEHFGYQNIPYNILRSLQKSNLVDKLSVGTPPKSRFVSSGREMSIEQPKIKEWHTVFGVRI